MEAADQTLWARHKGCHTCYAAGSKAVTNGEGDVILSADVQDLIPVSVGKVLYMLQQAQLQQTPTCLNTPLLSCGSTGFRLCTVGYLAGQLYVCAAIMLVLLQMQPLWL